MIPKRASGFCRQVCRKRPPEGRQMRRRMGPERRPRLTRRSLPFRPPWWPTPIAGPTGRRACPRRSRPARPARPARFHFRTPDRGPLELFAGIVCPPLGLLASKSGGEASRNLGAPPTEKIKKQTIRHRRLQRQKQAPWSIKQKNPRLQCSSRSDVPLYMTTDIHCAQRSGGHPGW